MSNKVQHAVLPPTDIPTSMTPSAFHTELAALVPRLRRLAAVLVRHGDEGDALVQATLQRALGPAASWHAVGRLDLWLFRLLVQLWRERRAAPAAGERQPAEPAEAATRQAVAMLSARERLVVALVLVEGLRYQQAASVLDVTEAVVADELARARQALHAVLPDHARSVP